MSDSEQELRGQYKIKVHESVGRQLPEGIDLGFCPIGQTTSKSLILENMNDYEVPYNFSECAFTIEPSSGIIQGRSRVIITISFTPQEATVLVGTAIYQSDYEENRVLKISGIGKYPYISLTRQSLNFETLLVNRQLTKEIQIKNQSQVPVKFQINKMQEGEFKEDAFTLDYYKGEIPPQCLFQIQVTYSPKIPQLFSCIHFEVECIGGNKILFECTGYAQPFKTYFNQFSINFGEIKLGSTTTRLLTIHNDTELQTTYQVFNDPLGIFSFNKTYGTINSKSHDRLIITFIPRNTISYHERIFCIVRNHQVLYVDLIGTCYDLIIKPIPLHQKHIDLFRKRVTDGSIFKVLANLSKNDKILPVSNTLQNSNKKYLEDHNHHNNTNTEHKNTNQSQSLQQQQQQQQQQQDDIVMNTQLEDELQQQQQQNQVVLHKEMMLDYKSQNRLVYVSDDQIDFGFCEPLIVSAQREVEVYNNLPVKITVFWILGIELTQDPQKNMELLSGYSFSNGKTEKNLGIFNVYPHTASLKPKSSCKFYITFRPQKPQAYYYQQVQFFSIKYSNKLTEKMIEQAKKGKRAGSASNSLQKNLENLKLTMNQTLSVTNQSILQEDIYPPLCLNIKCVGHTFSQNNQPFIPNIEISPSNKIQFRPCSIKESVYQTIQLKNKTDTPTYYNISSNLTSVFKVYQSTGLIQGNGFTIIIIEFSPTEPKYYNSVLNISYNHNLTDVSHIRLYGYCCTPEIQISNDSKLFFPPSYSGVMSKQKVQIHNISRIPIEYNLVVPTKYEDELYYEPRVGSLKPNQRTQISCAFIPLKKKQYKIKSNLQISYIVDPEQQLVGYYYPGSANLENLLIQEQLKQPILTKEYEIEIYGEGGDGSILMQPNILDFGIVKVNFSEKRVFIIENHSNVSFYIELKLSSLKDTNRLDGRLKNLIQKSFSLDFTEGMLTGKSRIEVGLMFSPIEYCELELVLECIAREKNPKGITLKTINNTKQLRPQKCLINIVAKGKYPQLKVVDVRNDSISVSTLWENFCINRINHELQSELTEDEIKYNIIETLPYTEAQQLQKRLRQHNWNFGYLPTKKSIKPRKIVLTVKNVGGTELEWKFKLPSDSQIDMEPWADPGEPTSDEAYERQILERKIFQINPKQGKLQPDGLCDIELLYGPSFDGGEDNEEKNKKNENHHLNVVLQIINGKALCINMQGMTLAPLQGLMAMKKKEIILPHVPIGSLLGVTFPIEMQNVGSGIINYRVDTSKFINKDETDFQNKIFDIKNPEGKLNPGEKHYLQSKFKPLEERTYEFIVPIQVSDFVGVIQNIELKITGQGYSFQLPTHNKKLQQEEIPRQRSLVSSMGSKVFFSLEEIDFGELPQGEPQYRMIILYNTSSERNLTYEFAKTEGLVCGDSLTIEPPSGELGPNEFIEIKLVLKSGFNPSVYEGEIECVILWDYQAGQNNKNTKSIENSISKSDATRDTSYLNVDKETLFLRIKKKSKISAKLKSLPDDSKSLVQNEDRQFIETIMSKIFSEILNDPRTETLIEKIDNQPVQLYSYFDGEEPANIHTVSHGLEDVNEFVGRKDFQDFRNLFLEEEFNELIDYMMEGVFFNIICETTHKETDLLKVGKTYIKQQNSIDKY